MPDSPSVHPPPFNYTHHVYRAAADGATARSDGHCQECGENPPPRGAPLGQALPVRSPRDVTAVRRLHRHSAAPAGIEPERDVIEAILLHVDAAVTCSPSTWSLVAAELLSEIAVDRSVRRRHVREP